MKFAELTNLNHDSILVIVDSDERQLEAEAEDCGMICRPAYLDELEDHNLDLRWPRDKYRILTQARELGREFFIA